MLGDVDAMSTLVVSEIFGPTIQGEGPTAGRPAHFVRLGRCNLDCAWCDTSYTWDWTGKNGVAYNPASLVKMEVSDVADAVSDAVRVVVSGGEPLLQATALADLSDRVGAVPLEIETNGTRPPPTRLIGRQFNVSPKLVSSGATGTRIVPRALATFGMLADAGEPVSFKFVVCSEGDIDEIADLERRFDLSNIWLMPEGRDADTLNGRLGWLAEVAAERGWHVTTRLHVLAWGDVRGR